MTPDEPPDAAAVRIGFATLIALGAIVVLVGPGAASIGAPPYVPDESWRRPLAFGLLGLLALVGPFGRRVLPPARGVALASLALAPAIAAALAPNGSAFELSSAPVFVAASAAILLASCVEGARGPARVLDGLGVAGLAAAALTLLDAATGRAAVGPFGRAGVAGPALAALLVPAIALGRRVPTSRTRAWRALPGVLVAAALVLTRSRTGMIAGGLAALAGSVVLVPAARRPRAASIAALLGAVAVAAAVLTGTRVLPGGDTMRVRAGLARAALALVAESPLLGHGPSGFAREALRVRDPEEARLSLGGRPLAAHDDLLHVAAENGVPAAIAVGAWLALALGLAIRRGLRATTPDAATSAATLGVVVATSLAALAEDPLLSIASSLPLALATGLLSVRRARAATPAHPAAATALRLASAGLLAWFALATWTLPLAADRALVGWIATRGADALDPARAPAAHAALRERARRARGDLHPPMLYRIAAGLAAEGRTDDAWTVYDRLLALDPGATEARLDVAELHRRDGRDDDALDVLRRARACDPTRFDVPLRMGHLTLGEEPLPGSPNDVADPVAALRLYDEAIALAPARFEGPAALARFHRRMGDLPTARRELARARALGGLTGETLLESFRISEAEGADPGASTAILSLALAASPSLAADVDRETRALLDAGDAEETRALEAAAKALSGADMSRTDAHYAAAVVRRAAVVAAGLASKPALTDEAGGDAARGRHRRAVATYRALLADPFGHEDPRVAFAAASSAARFDAALSDAFSARGRTLQGFEELSLAQLAPAERDFRAAIAKTPALAAAHYGLARTLALGGDEAAAAAALARAIELEPAARARAEREPGLASVVARLAGTSAPK